MVNGSGAFRNTNHRKQKRTDMAIVQANPGFDLVFIFDADEGRLRYSFHPIVMWEYDEDIKAATDFSWRHARKGNSQSHQVPG